MGEGSGGGVPLPAEKIFENQGLNKPNLLSFCQKGGFVRTHRTPLATRLNPPWRSKDPKIPLGKIMDPPIIQIAGSAPSPCYYGYTLTVIELTDVSVPRTCHSFSPKP